MGLQTRYYLRIYGAPVHLFFESEVEEGKKDVS